MDCLGGRSSSKNVLYGNRRGISHIFLLFSGDRCGSTDYRDVDIYNGQSVRRDCAKCLRFMGWPKWRDLALGDDSRAERNAN